MLSCMTSFESRHEIRTPTGGVFIARSVWQIDTGKTYLICLQLSGLATMQLELSTDAILTVDLPDDHLRVGDVGPVVERYASGDSQIGHTLEFFNLRGETITVVPVFENHLRLPEKNDDVPTTRDRRSG